MSDAQPGDFAAAGPRSESRARALERQKMSFRTHSDFRPKGIWCLAVKDAGLRSPDVLEVIGTDWQSWPQFRSRLCPKLCRVSLIFVLL